MKQEGHNVWRFALRAILRNTNAVTIKDWCKSAGITGATAKSLIGYSTGATIAELCSALGCESRALSSIRLRALKQLRCWLVSNPHVCPKFIKILAEYAPKDDGPQPSRLR